MSRSSSSSSIKKEEDMLFEFLNSNPPPGVSTIKGHTRNLSGPKTSTPRKPLSSTTPPSTNEETKTIPTKVDVPGIDFAFF